jgi:hypothetical protein
MRMPPPRMLLALIKSIWKAHGTQIMGALTFLISGADLLLIEILEVVPPAARPWVRLTVMGLAYAITHRAHRASIAAKADAAAAQSPTA